MARGSARWPLAAFVLAACWGAGAATGAGCGARSALEIEGSRPPSSSFCEEAVYRSGYSGMSIYVLLDASASMQNAGKWDQATTALAAFANDPDVAGLGMGLQIFPLGDTCDPAAYAAPAVAIAPLPDNAAAIASALAAHAPDGKTPTAPVLYSAIEYARSLYLADPSSAVVLALLTDGDPNACNSSTTRVAGIAKQGASEAPQVLTYVISLESGYLDALAQVARAGGTGSPIIIDKSGAAQQMVDALTALRDNFELCRFTVPPVLGAAVSVSDVTVSYQLSPDGAEVALPRVASAAGCSGQGFWVASPLSPSRVQLCPASCATVHGNRASQVIVRAGCGRGGAAIDAGAVDGGGCGGIVSFGCLVDCQSSQSQLPQCVGGLWQCPAGTKSADECASCPPVPHGCCDSDGTLAQASCLAGQWQCPPGAVIFGSPGCLPPEVCAAHMPCPASSYCDVADFTCGDVDLLGECRVKPSGCPPTGAPACGCDGVTYDGECQAQQAGIDVSVLADCPAPAGHFRCGPLFCDNLAEICHHTLDLSAPVPNAYDCISKPPGCPTGCGCGLCGPCPPGKQCQESCTTDDSGGAILLCGVI